MHILTVCFNTSLVCFHIFQRKPGVNEKHNNYQTDWHTIWWMPSRWSMLADSVSKLSVVFTAVLSASICSGAIAVSLIPLIHWSFDKHKTPASRVKQLLIYRLVCIAANHESWRADLCLKVWFLLIQITLQSSLHYMMICVWQDANIYTYTCTEISWG